jgi:hypothetical protein
MNRNPQFENQRRLVQAVIEFPTPTYNVEPIPRKFHYVLTHCLHRTSTAIVKVITVVSSEGLAREPDIQFATGTGDACGA